MNTSPMGWTLVYPSFLPLPFLASSSSIFCCLCELTWGYSYTHTDPRNFRIPPKSKRATLHISYNFIHACKLFHLHFFFVVFLSMRSSYRRITTRPTGFSFFISADGIAKFIPPFLPPLTFDDYRMRKGREKIWRLTTFISYPTQGITIGSSTFL